MSRLVRESESRGYRVDKAGQVRGPRGSVLKGTVKNGYRRYSMLDRISGTVYNVAVHRLVAYMKFGEAAMEPGIVTRHLNSDPLDNRWSNIGIGTHSDNMMDQPAEVRIAKAKKAAKALRRFNDTQVEAILRRKAKGWTYSRLSEVYGMSKGGLCSIVHGHQYPEFNSLREDLGLIP